MTDLMIREGNAVKIEQLLDDVNGRSREHAMTTYRQAVFITQLAERMLTELGLPKGKWAGARFTMTSGHSLPSKYRGDVNTTRAVIERRATGWSLVSVTKRTQPAGMVGSEDPRIALTRTQAEILHAKLDAKFDTMSELVDA